MLIKQTDLEKLLCQCNRDQSRRTAHARKIVGNNVGAHFEVIYNHGTKWRGWIKKTAVDDNAIDIFRSETTLC